PPRAAGRARDPRKPAAHQRGKAVQARAHRGGAPQASRRPRARPHHREHLMPDAVIVSTARTPIGKAYRGAFNMTHGATLGGHVVARAVARAGVAPAEVDDVVMGCAMPERATGHNIARLSAIRAGLPTSVGGMTINRFCSSGLQTIAVAAQRIIAGEA